MITTVGSSRSHVIQRLCQTSPSNIRFRDATTRRGIRTPRNLGHPPNQRLPPHIIAPVVSVSIRAPSYSEAFFSTKENAALSRASAAATAAVLLAAATASTAQAASLESAPVVEEEEDEDETTTILNWSGTHRVDVPTSRYHEPETTEELERIVRNCHETGTPLRPVGSALSPNGIGFRSVGMVNLINLDSIINVDKESMTVTVQAGARVGQVVDALREHGLTLPNLASIAEQQFGGFVQVGAHGTGAFIPPVDDFVTSLKLVTPARGTIALTAEDGELFDLAKVGLGCLGVVSEITMKCIPAHKLVEHTFVLTRAEARARLDSLLKAHKHVRYMWIPHEDAVVVVTNDPEDAAPKPTDDAPRFSPEEQFQPLTDLLLALSPDSTKESIEGMGFGELRDALLAINPLDMNHVMKVNKAEAEFWRRSEGYQTKPSDQLLQFDCGGQQWVWEVCFPTGTYSDNNGNDMMLMERLLKKIEEKQIPAPSPIEQRWSASSSSLMSPAHGPTGGLHSWVGIIMYLPPEDEIQRVEITAAFKEKYCPLFRRVGQDVGAVSHWAKLELPPNGSTHFIDLARLKHLMRSRYPVDRFNAMRLKYDPKNILGNNLINTVLGKPDFGPQFMDAMRAFH